MQQSPLTAINEVIEYLRDKHSTTTSRLKKILLQPEDGTSVGELQTEQRILLQALAIATASSIAYKTGVERPEPPKGEYLHWLPGLAQQVAQQVYQNPQCTYTQPQEMRCRHQELQEMRSRHRELVFTRIRLQLEPEDPAINSVLQDVEREIEILEHIL